MIGVQLTRRFKTQGVQLMRGLKCKASATSMCRCPFNLLARGKEVEKEVCTPVRHMLLACKRVGSFLCTNKP